METTKRIQSNFCHVTHVNAQVPDAMDYLLAEFNKVCMYTVPKHLHALNVSLDVTELFSIVVLSYLLTTETLCFWFAISWNMCPKDTIFQISELYLCF